MIIHDAATCGALIYGAERCASLGHPPGASIEQMQAYAPAHEAPAPSHIGFMSNFNLTLG